MTEQCYKCGHSWGVTMTPREKVLCTPCATPRPWRWPLRYWQHRLTTLPFGGAHDAEWWDRRTARDDLRIAVEFARAEWGTA